VKLKNKLQRLGFIFAGIIPLAVSFTTIYVGVFPLTGVVADPIVVGKSTYQCTAALSQAPTGTGSTSAVVTFGNVTNRSFLPADPSLANLAAGQVGGSPIPGEAAGAIPVFDAIYQNQSVLQVSFTGTANANENSACANSLVFYRLLSPTSGSTDTLYGVWDNGNSDPLNGKSWDFVTATIASNGTITYSLPAPSNYKASGSTLTDTSGLVATYFGGSSGSGGTTGGGGSAGGGTTSGGVTFASCVAGIGSGSSSEGNLVIVKACLAGKSASFTDIADIVFDGQQYTAVNWGGSTMDYALSQNSTDAALVKESPVLELDTNGGDSNGVDINIDGEGGSNKNDNVLSQLQGFASALQTAKKINVTLKISGFTANNVVPTTTAGAMNTVAAYYPGASGAAGTVNLLFASAGTNESPYFGSYSQTDATHYSLTSGGFSGCGNTASPDKPEFIFASDPSSPPASYQGSVLTAATSLSAKWQLMANDATCTQVTAPVNVIIEPAGSTPRIAPSAAAGDSQTPSCDTSGFSLSWIMCPIINGLAAAADGLYTNVVQPLLITRAIDINDSSDKSSQAIYQVWSAFRLYGDIFLVIALLVIVFGQSIGGGLIDAYTAKKVLPRILIAAILINLSIYLVAILVDLTNILGSGLITLITSPFSQTGNFDLTLNGTTSGLGLVALVGGVAWGTVAFSALLEFLLAFVLLPAFFILIAIMVTVLFRRGLIILLILVSPVAFAMYCLPNTEKYFKKWWDTLIEALLVYPIIASIFAVAKVLSVTISWGGETSGLASTFAQILAIIALFVPLLAIPFAFRLAGGILGKTHEALNNYGKKSHQAMLGNPNDHNSWRNRAKYKLGDRNTQLRERAVNRGYGDNSNIGTRALGKALNFGNLQAKRSGFNKTRSEMLQSQIATGDDSNIRDLFIAYDDGSTGNKAGWYRRMDMQNGRATAGSSSVYGNYSAGKSAHDKSMSLYGGDKSAVQDAMYYEWKKTSFSPTQMRNLEDQYGSVLAEHGFNGREGTEMMKAVGFRHQGQSLASKYSTFAAKKNAAGQSTGEWGWSVDHVGMAKETGFNLDTYSLSKQDVTTFDEFGKGYTKITQALDGAGGMDAGAVFATGHAYAGKTKQQLVDAQSRIKAIAESANPDQRMGGGGSTAPRDDGGTPQVASAGYGGVSNAPVEVQAAARRLYATVHPEAAGGGPQAPSSGQGNGGGDGGGSGSGPTIIIPPAGYTGSQG
jgi:hypothetical protein